MDQQEEAMVARALEIEPALLPYVPELLADFDALGSDVDQLVQLLGSLDLPAGARIVDLGSGKGALCVALAQRLNCEVTGIDLFEPFVRSSEQLARDGGVADRCRFLVGDIGKLAGTMPPFDVAIMAAVGDVLGDASHTVAIVRQFVKPGGFLVFSDGFIEDDVVLRHPGFENYRNLKEMRSALTAAGDHIVLEWIDDEDEAEAEAPSEEAMPIRHRAARLTKRFPHLAEAFEAYVASQEKEYEFLEEHFDDAIWILQRGP